MTQEDKKLLLVDISARLPYGVMCKAFESVGDIVEVDTGMNVTVRLNVPVYEENDDVFYLEFVKPYLRPMSSMTEEELNECIGISRTIKIPHIGNWYEFVITNPAFTDWLNAHHFDHRGLIEKGLALEAPEGMYNLK